MADDIAFPDRDVRQRDIINPATLKLTTAFVVGTGAIGRQVAIQLAAIGVGTLILIDPDTVGPENLAAQGFLEDDIGQKKVDAVAKLCLAINSDITIETYDDKFKRLHLTKWPQGLVFCCVDSMEARKFIWKTSKGRCDMFVDGRMTAEVCRILTVREEKDYELYESTLFTDAEAYQGTCTAKTTLYCANIVAGFMVAQLPKLFRRFLYDWNVQVNILANELTCEKG